METKCETFKKITLLSLTFQMPAKGWMHHKCFSQRGKDKLTLWEITFAVLLGSP